MSYALLGLIFILHGSFKGSGWAVAIIYIISGFYYVFLGIKESSKILVKISDDSLTIKWRNKLKSTLYLKSNIVDINIKRAALTFTFVDNTTEKYILSEFDNTQRAGLLEFFRANIKGKVSIN